MRLRVIFSLVLVVAFASSCTPAFSVRLYNRTGHDVTVKWKDSYLAELTTGKDKIVGSAHDWDAKNLVSVTSGVVVTEYRIPDLWDLPKEAMRAMRFPAAGGSRECCLELGVDYVVYALHAETLQRLYQQPSGFPIAPLEKTERADL